MRVVVAGSRSIENCYEVCLAIMESGFDVTEVVCGRARGVDTIGEAYAHVEGIPVKVFTASWELHGNAAGPIRNTEMADYADAAVVVWDGKSSGSRNMIEQMERRGKPVYVHVVGEKRE